MAEPLKDQLNRDSVGLFAEATKVAYPPFQIDQFLDLVFDQSWAGLELKARSRHITTCLGQCLPANYRQALGLLDQAAANYRGWVGPVFQNYVEQNGLAEANWDLSLAFMEKYTEYWSAEFAVRPFIIHNQERMLKQMLTWTAHPNEHVRRLASEGCRPQLPWAGALASLKANPAPILPILERLKADPYEYVRRSVANNLNDISKTHPDLVLELAGSWFGDNQSTDRLIKHALRTLLKQGNSQALAMFAYDDVASIKVEGFRLEASSVAKGQSILFTFTLVATAPVKVRLEYAVDYVKAHGKTSRKVFQISEVCLQAGQIKTYSRKHPLADLSTRKHYPGSHLITLIVNGHDQGTGHFELTE